MENTAPNLLQLRRMSTLSYVLQKIIAAAISPLGSALGLWLAALVCMAWRGQRGRRAGMVLAVAGTAWLWTWATPAISDLVVRHVEAGAGPARVEDLPNADVIVVLGGALRPPDPPHQPYPDMNLSADRVWHAARLFHAGKAPWVLVSGGTASPQLEPEAASTRRLLEDLGVPAQAILLEPDSVDTVTNAQRTADVMRRQGLNTALLVTSALHMRRALSKFRAAGSSVEPAPSDFEAASTRREELNWYLPNGMTLDRSGRAFKEWAAYLMDL